MASLLDTEAGRAARNAAYDRAFPNLKRLDLASNRWPSWEPRVVVPAEGVIVRGPAPADYHISGNTFEPYTITREEMAAADPVAWRPGDHVLVTPPPWPRRVRATLAVERQRAVLVGGQLPWKGASGMFYTRWRVRWVASDGVLGEEATISVDQASWVMPVPTREPAYEPPRRERYSPRTPR